MSKNIVLLSDGTGNSNIKDRGTNVFKFYEALDFNGLHSKKKQVAFYDDGVGTEEFKPLKILGGAFGWGLANNVKSLYKRLVQVYEPGGESDPADKVFLFGFSRGAFTVRTLAGLIASEGILDVRKYPRDDLLDLAVLQLYENYRAKQTAILEDIFYKPIMGFFFNAYGNGNPVTHGEQSKKIEFIGVWDTVDAVGFPVDEMTDLWNKLIFRFKFRDRNLHTNIQKACHALSIDDQRESFHPLLWHDGDPRIEQVWFPGVHANVGGGYPQHGLSLVALDWMIIRAEAAGLQFIPNEKSFVHDQKYAFDKLYDSRAGVGVYYHYQPRDIAKISLDKDVNIKVPQIHVSVFQRIGVGILGYAPGNLPDKFSIVQDGEIDPKSLTIINTIHPESETISALVAQHLNNQGLASRTSGVALSSPLLQKIKELIHLRRGIYYVFLGYSLFTLYWLVRADIKGNGFFEKLESTVIAIQRLAAPENLLAKLAQLLWSDIWLTIVGILILCAATFVRKAIARSFSTFWSGVRISIKQLV